eukprot:6042430-Amphidinium_carterae.1
MRLGNEHCEVQHCRDEVPPFNPLAQLQIIKKGSQPSYPLASAMEILPLMQARDTRLPRVRVAHAWPP